jgi:glycosyltransferase involved in cell wall biosynthesis
LEIKKQPTAVICLSPYSGGMELEAISFAKKLDKMVDTVLIVKEKSFMAKQLENENKIRYKTISFYKSLSLSIVTNVRDIVKDYGIKNVIFFGASELKSLYFSFLGLDINLIIRHSTTKSRPKKDWLHRLVYCDVNYHVSTSKHLLHNVRKIIPFGKNSKEKLIYSSFEFSKPHFIDHDILTIVHTGRIADAKGQIDAIKACEILYINNIDFKFYIVGEFDKSYKEEFMNFFDSIAYKEKIELVGFTSNVPEYLHKSDIFLFPSYGEGISISFREALANNLISIAYNNTSFPELQNLGLYFYLVDDRNIEELSNQLLSIAQNIVIEKDKVKNNYEVIMKVFSEKEEIKNYLSILI